MTVECDAMASSDDFSFQDFDSDDGILNGRGVSWIDPCRDDEDIRNLLFKNADDFLHRSAPYGRMRAGRWQKLDIVKIDLVDHKNLIARSFFSKLWKKNKKTILFVAAALVAAAAVGIVVAAALGAAAAASGNSDSSQKKPDDPAQNNPPPENRAPPAVSPPSPSNLAMQPAPVVIAPLKETPDLKQRNLIPDIQPIPSAINIFNSISNPSPILPYPPTVLAMLPVSPKTSDALPIQVPSLPTSQTLLDPPRLPALGVPSPAIKTTFVSDYKTPSPLASSPAKQSWIADFLKTVGQGMIDPDLMNPNAPLPSAEISTAFTTGGTKNPRIGIGGINGMNTSLNEAINHADYLAQFAPNLSINWVHNRSHGPLLDLAEIFSLNYTGHSPNTAPLLQKEWEAFHQANADRPNAKYLQICHSQGALHVRNALMHAPKEIRDRVIVIAIAPAVVISKKDCYQAVNYACKGDIVPHGELAYLGFFEGDRPEPSKTMEAAIERQGTIIWLDPHPDTKNVHDFQNPAFIQILKNKIEDHLIHNGEYK
jgi:hypothetical protein